MWIIKAKIEEKDKKVIIGTSGELEFKNKILVYEMGRLLRNY